MSDPNTLPIADILPTLDHHLQHHDTLVIQAPPGAGKTTLLPLHLLRQCSTSVQRLILIQPRRLAVYGAAHYIASQLGEQPGAQIGYRTRFDSRESAASRLLIVTEGIFLRMIQQDPALTGISGVLFDEFHERSSTLDLALAFARDSQQGFRDAAQPLKLLIMSATLNGTALSEWLNAPLLACQGRQFPVATVYRPLSNQQALEAGVSEAVLSALSKHPGSALVFLPGWREIQRVAERLRDQVPDTVDIHALHGTLSPQAQQQAIQPASAGRRKVVLATNIAETSLTITDIQIVIDSGLVRRLRYQERRAMDSLQTERISQASAEQRRGRAGRVSAGVCYRLWSEADQQRLSAFDEPELLHCDLVPVALEMALWGCRTLHDLQLLDYPDPAAFARARELLASLGLLNAQGLATETAHAVARLGMSPRLGLLIHHNRTSPAVHSVIACAALLSEGDPLRFAPHSHQADLGLRLALQAAAPGAAPDTTANAATQRRITQLCRQLAQRAGVRWQPDQADHHGLAACLAQVFPDRVAQRRADSRTRYRLANGRGAQLSDSDSLARSAFLVVLDSSGHDLEPRITLACAISLETLQFALAHLITERLHIAWNHQRDSVEVEQQRVLGSLVLHRQTQPKPWPPDAQACLLEQVQQRGLACLPWNDTSRQLVYRVRWLHQQQADQWPDWSEPALLATLSDWLTPWLTGCYSLAALAQLDLYNILLNQLDWPSQCALAERAPSQFRLPAGHDKALDYSGNDGPILRDKLQAFFGCQTHPSLPGGQRILIELLSPAGRPLQITRDLPGFWSGSYQQVAKEMRGRYPKHPWPDDPANAQATLLTKARLQRTQDS